MRDLLEEHCIAEAEILEAHIGYDGTGKYLEVTAKSPGFCEVDPLDRVPLKEW